MAIQHIIGLPLAYCKLEQLVSLVATHEKSYCNCYMLLGTYWVLGTMLDRFPNSLVLIVKVMIKELYCE